MGGEVQAAREDDRALLALVRDGDLDAYGELYARHSAAAHRFARSLLANRTDADDAVAEVFASLLGTLRRGRGPTEQFLPYLLTSVRNECRRANRRGSRESVDRREQVTHLIDARRAHEDPAGDLAEGAVIATALTTLPPHLREILWRTEVEEEPARAIAAERGATPHAVAESARRARRALGSAYLQLHVGDGLPADEADPECDAARPHLAAYVRRTVGLRRRRHIDRHLRTCPSCAAAHDALARVNRRLRARPLLPVDVGGLGVVSWGVKAQVLTWLSATAGPIAASGAVVIAVFAPTHHGGLDRVEAASQAPAEVVVTAPVPAGEDPVSRAAPAATTPDDVARPTVASRQASTAAAGADVPPEQPSTTAPAPVLAEPEPTLAPPPAPAGGPPPAVLAATDGAPDLGVPAPSAAAPSAPPGDPGAAAAPPDADGARPTPAATPGGASAGDDEGLAGRDGGQGGAGEMGPTPGVGTGRGAAAPHDPTGADVPGNGHGLADDRGPADGPGPADGNGLGPGNGLALGTGGGLGRGNGNGTSPLAGESPGRALGRAVAQAEGAASEPAAVPDPPAAPVD